MHLHYLPGGARIKIDMVGGWPGYLQLDVIDQHGKSAVAVLTCDQADAIGLDLFGYATAARPRNGKKMSPRLARFFGRNKWGRR